MKTGRTSSIGTTAVQLSTTPSALCGHSITVKADQLNSATVYVGTSTVTANSADATDGYPLEPGESYTFAEANPTAIYVVSTASGQKCWWAGD